MVGTLLLTSHSSAQGVYAPRSSESRAEQEAERSVALSPDKIIEMLRQEPGLLLVAKRCWCARHTSRAAYLIRKT